MSVHLHVHAPKERGGEWRWSLTRTAWSPGTSGISNTIMDGYLELPAHVELQEATALIMGHVSSKVLAS